MKTLTFIEYYKKLFPFMIAMVFFYIALPIMSDDWVFSSMFKLNSLFYMSKSVHSGRHAVELLIIASEKVVGNVLGAMLASPLWGLKIAHGLTAGLVAFGFWIISSCYGILDNKNNRTFIVYLYSLVLFSFSLPMFLFVYNYYMMNIGSLMLALFAWLPFIYYYRYQSLPKWMKSYSNYQIIGIYILVFYLGTQVHDSTNYVLLGMSLMLAVYLIGRYLILKQKETFLLYILLIMHISFGFYGMFRNIFMSDQMGFRLGKINLLNRAIFHGGEYSQVVSLFYYFSLLFALVICIYYLIKFFNNKKIECFDFYIFSTQVVGLVVILGLNILNSYFTAPLWILWIVQISILISLFKNKNKFVSILFPILCLHMFINGINVFHDTFYLRSKMIKRVDVRLVELFKQAEQSGVTELTISPEMAISLLYEPFWGEIISKWMLEYGYTTKYIPIVIKYK